MSANPLLSWARENRFAFLVFSILALVLVSPFFAESSLGRTVIVLATLLVLMTGAYAAAGTRRETHVTTLLLVPAILGYLSEEAGGDAPFRLAILPFLLWVVFTVFRHVRRSVRVTGETLFGALGVYLLLGFLWSHLYEILAVVSPGAFRGTDGTPGEFLYFSFVTLTTLGYGDISPATPVGRSLVVVQAVTGVVYMAVMIGGLVGMYVSTPQDD